uniref:V-type proton ATPase proteolipid subunit n=1 Tax=Phascolarctos cinereus TaxID=38626 RepID=A0A6P5KQM0_PHACI|nr:V-type proton ATPase 16 kDa proteolipid subunit-like [Phascolarctos cinereus]
MECLVHIQAQRPIPLDPREHVCEEVREKPAAGPEAWHPRARARASPLARPPSGWPARAATTDGPEYASFFAVMGSALGAAYGTAKSGTSSAAVAVVRPRQITKAVIPVVMAGIIAIYGLAVAVLLISSQSHRISLFKSFLQLGAGLSVGLGGLAAGFAVGVVGEAGVWDTAQQPRFFLGMILVLIFAEVLGLYGLIVALILCTQ